MIQAFKLEKENGYVVPCVSAVPDNPKAIVVMVHGFESSKECATGELLRRRLPPAGFGVICYDGPGHGTAEARKEPFRLGAGMASLARVEAYAHRTWPERPIYYFASSYGAYMTALYISTRRHLGGKLFMRSAAVCMPELFLGTPENPIDPAYLKQMDELGYATPNMGLGNPVRVPKGMLDDLRENDLFEKFVPYPENDVRVQMVHGECDAVIPVEKALAFARKFRITIRVMRAQGHSLSDTPEAPERVADQAIAFFNK